MHRVCGRPLSLVGYAWIKSIDYIGVSGHANPPYESVSINRFKTVS